MLSRCSGRPLLGLIGQRSVLNSRGKPTFSTHTRDPDEDKFRLSDIDNQKEAHELIFKRIANMIVNMTDNQYAKVLQIYPESKNIIQELGRKKNFEFTGVSVYPEKEAFQFGSKKKFSRVLHLDMQKDLQLPFPTNTFSVVMHCLPFVHTAPQPDHPFAAPALCIEELVRVTNDPGWVIYGCTRETWEAWDLEDVFGEKNDDYTLLSKQILRFNPTRMDEHGSIIDNDDDVVAIVDETPDLQMEEYVLCMIAKGEAPTSGSRKKGTQGVVITKSGGARKPETAT